MGDPIITICWLFAILESFTFVSVALGGSPRIQGRGQPDSHRTVVKSANSKPWDNVFTKPDQQVKQDNFTYKIFWGLACNCSNLGIDLGLEKWGISANQDTSNEHGEAFTAFHRNDFNYPYIDDDTGVFVNGGLPQANILNIYLEKATQDIKHYIPSPEFNGLAVVDWEKWRPHLDQNAGVRTSYKAASMKVVKQRHPHWDNGTIETVATVEFEEAAQGLMQGVLHLGKKLRPKATWGFYHYPYCDNKNKTTDYACALSNIESNDKMMWLFDESSALFPSIYLRPYVEDNYHFVEARLQETLRVLETLEEPGKPVYVYNRFNYSHSSFYYNIGDIQMSMRKAASLSFDGIVIWGSFTSLNNNASCLHLKQLLASIYGPTLLNTKTQAEGCSREMCSGYGRCLLNDSKVRKTPKEALWKWQNMEFIRCRCITGWIGKDCSTKSNNS
ncbi:hyaluronidase-like [Anneissia japonica]|uniref:hyaluronidase-like n=1 Tax=Anneissia japonica TaxID=1529436 RepID=UPI0014257312|nr:hyaluronidase-like [Anneissia japonica]